MSVPLRGQAIIEMRRGSDALDRLSVGSEQLDAVLHGGLPQYSAVIISGLPGTGKTILSQQAAFANARAGRTCLYLTTLSEPPLKMLRYLQGFTFFQPDLVATGVLYSDLGAVLRTDGAADVLTRVAGLLREHRPELVVIDSFKCLRDVIRDPLAWRAFTHDIVVQLTTWEATALLVGEYTPKAVREEAEFAIADGIIDLSATEVAEEQTRVLRVLKMRGTSFLAGAHAFAIDASGLTLSPAAGSAGGRRARHPGRARPLDRRRAARYPAGGWPRPRRL